MSGRVFVAGAWVDDDVMDGQGVFETIGARAGALPLWSHHLRRLRAAAQRLGLPWRPPGDLQATVHACLRRHAHDVARVSLLRAGDVVRWGVHTRTRDRDAEPLRLVMAPSPRPLEPARDCKTWPRPWLLAARAEARAAGAHDAVLWRDGCVLEATSYSVFVLVGDRLRTPPADGSVLPGIARALLLRAGLPIDEARVGVDELQASRLVLLTNAVHGPRLAELRPTALDAVSRDILAGVRAAWELALRPGQD